VHVHSVDAGGPARRVTERNTFHKRKGPLLKAALPQ
jgi:hypothetical protein